MAESYCSDHQEAAAPAFAPPAPGASSSGRIVRALASALRKQSRLFRAAGSAAAWVSTESGGSTAAGCGGGSGATAAASPGRILAGAGGRGISGITTGSGKPFFGGGSVGEASGARVAAASGGLSLSGGSLLEVAALMFLLLLLILVVLWYR